MTRIAHILAELGRNLTRNFWTAIASFLSLTLLYLLFDLFWVAAGVSDRFYRDLLSELRVEAFVEESVADSTVSGIEGQIRAIEGVADFEYISRETARSKLAAMVGTDLLIGYDERNPLPRSFLLTIREDYLNGDRVKDLSTALTAIDGVADVSYSESWLEKAETTKSVILQIGLALGVLIFATALVSSTNNIRLMTRSRAVGFRQMRLLGAGSIFLSLPSVIEGFLISGGAAALGWLILFYGRSKVQFSQIEVIVPSTDEIIIFCAVTAFLGAVSGYLGLRKLLKD